MHKAFFTALAISVAFIFCKNEAKSTIFQNEFYVRYMFDEQKTLAQASFKKGETEDKLASYLMPEVFFHDGVMRERVLEKIIRYQSEKTGGMERINLFRWKNEAGSTQKIEMQIDPILEFELSEPFRATENALVKWSGAGPLQKEEKLTVLFEDQKTNETQSFEFVGPTDLAAVPIPVSKVKAGKWAVSLVKTKTEARDEGTQRQRMTFEFYSKTIIFDVK